MDKPGHFTPPFYGTLAFDFLTHCLKGKHRFENHRAIRYVYEVILNPDESMTICYNDYWCRHGYCLKPRTLLNLIYYAVNDALGNGSRLTSYKDILPADFSTSVEFTKDRIFVCGYGERPFNDTEVTLKQVKVWCMLIAGRPLKEIEKACGEEFTLKTKGCACDPFTAAKRSAIKEAMKKIDEQEMQLLDKACVDLRQKQDELDRIYHEERSKILAEFTKKRQSLEAEMMKLGGPA